MSHGLSILDKKWFQSSAYVLIWRKKIEWRIYYFSLSFRGDISVCACFLKLWGNFNYLTHRSFKLKFEWERRAGFSAILLVISKHFLIFLQIKLGGGGRGNQCYPYNFTQVSPKYLLNLTQSLSRLLPIEDQTWMTSGNTIIFSLLFQ